MPELSNFDQIIDIRGLEKQDLCILFFRVTFDVGFAIEKHQKSLVSALQQTHKPLFEFLREKSKNWIDKEVEKFSDLDYATHLKIVRCNILNDANGEPPILAKAYKKIAGELQRQRKPRELATELKHLSDDTHGLVGRAIERFGRSLSKTRWQECRAAVLAFCHDGENGPTRCTFEADNNVITIRIGNHLDSETHLRKGALRTYYNMRFYFFHEYLSHSFSCWQHTDFVEGYLVWAAKEMFFRITGDKVRHAFIKDTFEVSLMGSRDMATVKLNAAKMVAEWFQSMTDGKFLAFILDWAADSSYLVDRADIDALFYLSEMCTKGMHLLEDICTAFEEANLQATRCKLRSIARQTAGIPDYEGHFHPDSVLPCLVC